MVPANVHTIASDFRLEHGNDLSTELINQLLANLNKIWREREKKVVARIKAKCEAQITQMKRQCMSRQPVDVVTLKKNYARVSSELAAAKIELNDAKVFKEKA